MIPLESLATLPIAALGLVVAIGVALALRAGAGPAAAFVTVAAAMVAVQGSVLGEGHAALPPTAALAFLATPVLPGLMAALLFPPSHDP